MIRIDRLRLRLPAGFEHRALSIARRVGEMLAEQSVSQDLAIDSVTLSPLKIRIHTSDDEIARLITLQIVAQQAGGAP
ncbi:hypothetical protein [Accumulibacter sp.]|uniref:Uncharacterized protein n=1 Tax=Candidatus Accumulibacter phosphatis TaxID=327160 RepID=A0A080LYX4_9PROT|nr:hypothetical protein [Accumulibacter sp.]KFB74048.1 MAG: hypothetical protein AW09_000679 [Candidatus Accumulibacter phosphatis]HRF06672.1 hypothetical protein [Accumulibacter sp.]